MPAIRSESTSKANRPGNKPVECGICHKVLNRQPDLNRHMLTHGEEKRYKCNFDGCPFTAIQHSNLKTHLNTHTKQKNHTCPDCNYATSDPAALTRHRKRQHNYTPKPRRKMPNEKKGKAPAVPPSTFFEQQYPFAIGQPIAGSSGSATLGPATFTDYASSPSPSPSASGSERYPSEPYEFPAAPAEYSAYGSPSGSHETGDDYYYPSPLNSDDEAASVGGSRGGTPSSVSSASSSGSSYHGTPSRESSVGASSVRSRSASIPPPLPLPGSSTVHREFLNTSTEDLHQQAQAGGAGADAGLEDATRPARCVGAQPWMQRMIQTDDFNLLVQDPYQIETHLYLPTPTTINSNNIVALSSLGGCVPNIGGLAWEPRAIFGFGAGISYFNFHPVPSPPPVFEEVKIQQQQQFGYTRTPSPSPPSSREGTPVLEHNNESWFLSPRA